MYIPWLQAKELLSDNSVIAFPTDTVYGLAANAFSEEGVARIYQLKGRDFRKPLVLMCADIPAAQKLTDPWAKDVLEVARHYWPGALTLILTRDAKKVPDNVVAGRNTVGIRIPDHKDLLRLLSALPFPLAVTSANRSGEKELTRAEDVNKIFGDTIDGVINDDTALKNGVPSTVVDVTSKPWKVLREGPVKIVLKQ
jgi:L-threonylcarbamoyladenylate synthase